MYNSYLIPADVPIEEAGLPRCQTCRQALLDGSTKAMKEKGDVGDWTSLELVCVKCGAVKKGLEVLQCESPTCREEGEPAVTVAFGYALCKTCAA